MFPPPVASTSKHAYHSDQYAAFPSPDVSELGSMPSSSVPNSASSKHGSSHRLLWRGSLVADTGAKIHGIAFVAHLPQGSTSPVTTLTRPPANPFQESVIQSGGSSSSSNNDNPFTAPPSADQREQEANMNLCLELEMLRHVDLPIQRSVDLQQSSSANNVHKRKRGSLKNRIESLKKGNDGIEVAEDTSDGFSVAVYVDPRCSSSMAWMQRRFCERQVDVSGRTTRGLLLALGQEGFSTTATAVTNLVLYGQLIPGTTVLQLKLGRKKVPPPAPRARPDDPLPRESLFAEKLRRSASTPNLSFDEDVDHPPFKAPPPTTSKPDFARSKSSTAAFPPPTATARNPFAVSSRASSEATKKRKESTLPTTPGRGCSGKRAKRSASFQELPGVDEVDEEPLLGSKHANGAAGEDWTEKNKQMIKVLVANQLARRNVSRTDEEYRELYTATSRGVSFAMRHSLAGGEVAKSRVVSLTNVHLKMYMTSDRGS